MGEDGGGVRREWGRGRRWGGNGEVEGGGGGNEGDGEGMREGGGRCGRNKGGGEGMGELIYIQSRLLVVFIDSRIFTDFNNNALRTMALQRHVFGLELKATGRYHGGAFHKQAHAYVCACEVSKLIDFGPSGSAGHTRKVCPGKSCFHFVLFYFFL